MRSCYWFSFRKLLSAAAIVGEGKTMDRHMESVLTPELVSEWALVDPRSYRSRPAGRGTGQMWKLAFFK